MDRKQEPARQSELSATDCVIRATEDFGEHNIERVCIVAMNDDGTERRLYSNVRSEPEMFGVLTMALESWTDNILEDD
jgi:hypothetical protein